MKKTYLTVLMLAFANILVFALSAGGGAQTNGISVACASGGVGSTQCSIDANVVGNGAGCSVSCGPGYYACCGVGCYCVKSPKDLIEYPGDLPYK